MIWKFYDNDETISNGVVVFKVYKCCKNFIQN